MTTEADGARQTGPALEKMHQFVLWLIPTVEKFPQRQRFLGLAGNQGAILVLQNISPVAWRHIHFLGRYLFRDRGHPIVLNTLLADISLA